MCFIMHKKIESSVSRFIYTNHDAVVKEHSVSSTTAQSMLVLAAKGQNTEIDHRRSHLEIFHDYNWCFISSTGLALCMNHEQLYL